MQSLKPLEEFDPTIHYTVRAASSFSFEALAEIYNQTRVDYIVPMPMNAKRMREYVTQYDIDLDVSVVGYDQAGEAFGLNMVAFRDQRAWITRLGVIPERRLRKSGQFLMDKLLERARERGVKAVQLEVIEGNEPAYRLFLKCGFVETRRLMIIRRPPGKLEEIPVRSEDTVTILTQEDIAAHLADRCDQPAWLEETVSLLNTASLKGLYIACPDGKTGWVIYQHSPFQITHIVLSQYHDDDFTCTLLYHLHRQHPTQDTKTENLPTDSPHWAGYQRLGYLEVFRRIEMILGFNTD